MHLVLVDCETYSLVDYPVYPSKSVFRLISAYIRNLLDGKSAPV